MKKLILLPTLASAILLAGCHTPPPVTTATSPAPTATAVPTPPPAPAANAAAAVNLTGDWNWTCCDAHYHGTFTLQQDGSNVTGKLYDEGDTTGGAIAGTIAGNTFKFTRTWGDDSHQDYTLTISGDGNKVEGELDGTRDENVSSHFIGTRK